MGQHLRRSAESNDLIQPSLETGKEDETMRMTEADSKGKMTDKNSGNVGAMSDTQGTIGQMSQDSAPETMDLLPEDDDIKDGDPNDEPSNIFKRAIVKHRIKKGNETRTDREAYVAYGQVMVVLKLKKKWVKEKHWEYYAHWLEKEYGIVVDSYQAFCDQDTTSKDGYFRVKKQRAMPGPLDKGGEVKQDGGDVKKEEEVVKQEGEDVKKEEEVKKDEVKPPVKTVTKVTQHNEKKVSYYHQPAPAGGHIIGDNIKHDKADQPEPSVTYAVNNVIDKTVTLDPTITYVVLVKGVSVKDKVTIKVDGKIVDGDTKARGGRRHFSVPAGSKSVQIVVQMESGSTFTIDVLPNEDIKHTKWRTIETTYYSDGTDKHRTVKNWSEDEKMPFSDWLPLDDWFFEPFGPVTIISGQ